MREHAGYPSIAPIPEGVHRPLWSVMIPTYNCAHLLELTLKSVLQQDPGPEEMQIEVIDDRSTNDDPEAVVREIGKGRVSFFRQPQNVGAQANFTTCIQRSRGHLVHILHGDDAVLPGFYSRLREGFDKEPTIGAAFCRSIFIDDDSHWLNISEFESRVPGILSNWLEQIAVKNRIFFPSIVVRRSTYEKLGGFHSELIHTSDWDMWKRIAAHYPVWFEPQPLALYRQHAGSDTSRLVRSGADIADIRRSIEIAQSYLPKPKAAELTRKARQEYSFSALFTARKLFSKGDITAATAQLREALKCSHSSQVAGVLAYHLIWLTVDSIKRTLRTGTPFQRERA